MTTELQQGAEGDPPPPRVLIIDDEAALLRVLTAQLTRAGFHVRGFTQPFEGLAAASDLGCDVVIADIVLPHLSGVELLKALKAKKNPAEVILITGGGSIAGALEAVRLGAYDYLTKPFLDMDAVIATVRRAADRKRLVQRNLQLEQLLGAQPDPGFIGESAKMRAVFAMIDQVSYSASTVLIHGESGTGKELVARSIHRKSQRAASSFVAINCAAMTETLLESELFGHVKGAFTGASGAKQGLVEAAHRGTLFLDEIGDMPLTTQVKLLRMLQEGEVRPVGAVEPKMVDVRLIAATNVDLPKAIREGKFREDLYYRINVIAVRLPPLRDRPTDVPLLAHHFLKHYAGKLGKKLNRISHDALEALVGAPWPGNVRELENVIERAVVLARGSEVTMGDLPPDFGEQAPQGDADGSALLSLNYTTAKRLTIAAFDRRYLSGALRKANNNISVAASQAGLDRSNFRRLLKEYHLLPLRGVTEDEPPGWRPEAAAPGDADGKRKR